MCTLRNSEQKFSSLLSDFENILRGISRLAIPPALSAPSLDLLLPEKDRPVLTSAIQHRCHALLTGDKTHFGRLYGQTIAGVSIHSRQGLARRSREQGKAERRIQRIKRQKAVYGNITQQVVIFPAEPKL